MRGVRAAVSEILRALSICVPVAVVNMPAVLAQTVASSTLAAAIPAQPLAQALAEFASLRSPA
jgi:hypothetical protein